MNLTKLTPIAGLLTGATVWGLIWYPYRALEQSGIAGDLAATLTYAIAFVFASVVFRRQLAWRRCSLPLVYIGLSAGWANIGFTYAVIYGEVMRVVLLFYLAPVWTVLLAHLLLGEKPGAAGAALMALAVGGALVMLWDPQMSFPLPRAFAEWVGLSAGMMFALSNVLSRRHAETAIGARLLAVLGGGIAVGSLSVLVTAPPAAVWRSVFEGAGLLCLLGGVIFSVNVAVQYGLANVGANRAIVIYLLELVVTALAAWLLAGETLAPKEWCGGLMIIGAGLWSARLAVPAKHRD